MYSGNVPARVLKSVSVAWCDLRYLQGHKINESRTVIQGSTYIIDVVLDSISLRKAPNMIYCIVVPFSQWKFMLMMKQS